MYAGEAEKNFEWRKREYKVTLSALSLKRDCNCRSLAYGYTLRDLGQSPELRLHYCYQPASSGFGCLAQLTFSYLIRNPAASCGDG